ncbi:MAG: 30S ribosomal protein S8 [Candidatus Colwellbacteria bacterium CG10_big_fil_rev_8_21_14_0_10_41_28]|uniref:Small ribosomal subunit protein uS8 n=1 Tax=Candidatus Colwellbacteria bacterium CG10_big_fil_rev_8_21_14_0_10_41_28 TaxID=1974539 RepID=A0A2H0VH95_9BACT|nr:MAG: 30S ribosomal protein S8 [Candidatus Colwellbacteria bacterium CG10_big_fil_rev_8_21_14_0_10_41_28]
MYHDTLTRIKNSLARGQRRLKVPYTRFDMDVLETLVKAGYIESVERKGRGLKRVIDIKLKYNDKNSKEPSILGVKFISKPSRRMYVGYDDIKKSHDGYGHFIVSTPKGVMNGYEARKNKVGGQILFEIW